MIFFLVAAARFPAGLFGETPQKEEECQSDDCQSSWSLPIHD